MSKIGRKLTLLLPTFKGDSDDIKHLFFILTNPCVDVESQKQDMLLLVNCTSVEGKARIDETCLLKQGDHPFIKKDSFILYSEARIEPLLFIENGIKIGRFTKKEIVDDELYIKILKGLFTTKKIHQRYIRFAKRAIQQKACLDVFNLSE